MNYLNSRISQYEAKLKQTQQYLKAQEQEYEGLLQKVGQFRSRYAEAALLLSEFVENLVEQDQELLQR